MAAPETTTKHKQKRRHHFVLVHRMCHGAWCWYKAATALRRLGHRATALDMAGCSSNPARLADVRTFEEYSRPLLDAMAALPPRERVVLVAHSHGGYSVALAVERFPEKVVAAVFVTASMPAVGRAMAATSDETEGELEVGRLTDDLGLQDRQHAFFWNLNGYGSISSSFKQQGLDLHLLQDRSGLGSLEFEASDPRRFCCVPGFLAIDSLVNFDGRCDHSSPLSIYSIPRFAFAYSIYCLPLRFMSFSPLFGFQSLFGMCKASRFSIC